MATSVNTSVTITYDWGGSLTYSQTIVPGTDGLIWKISDFPTDYRNDFQTKLNTDVTIDGINFNEISIYKNTADGSWFWPTTSTSKIVENLTVQPLFHFQATKNIRIIRNLSESTHTNRGSTQGTLCSLNSQNKFNLTENDLILTYTVNHSNGLYPLTYNNKTYNAYGWAENDQWNSIYTTGTSITVNTKAGYPTPIVKNYAEVYTDSTPINLIINNNSTDETQITKLRDQTLLMVLETSLSTQSNPITILPKNPFSKKGYKFRGWSLNKDDLPGSSTVLAPGTSVSLSESTTYYAIWELKPQSSLRMWYGMNGKWTPMS